MAAYLDERGNLVDSVTGKYIGLKREPGMSDSDYIAAGTAQMKKALEGFMNRVMSGTENIYDIRDAEIRKEQIREYFQGGSSGPVGLGQPDSSLFQVLPSFSQPVVLGQEKEGKTSRFIEQYEQYIVLGAMVLLLTSILNLFRR